MKFEKLLKEWHRPLRTRAARTIQLKTEMGLYHGSANDEGRGQRLGTLGGHLLTLEGELRSAARRIPESTLEEIYGGVDVVRSVLCGVYEQLLGSTPALVPSDEWEDPREVGVAGEMYGEAHYPPPEAGPTLSRRLQVPVVFRCLDGRCVSSSLEVVLHFDWVAQCHLRLEAGPAGGVEGLDILVLGTESELGSLPKVMRFDGAGGFCQVSGYLNQSDCGLEEPGDEGIINSWEEEEERVGDFGEGLEREPGEQGWLTESERPYRGMRVWLGDAEEGEVLVGIGEPGEGLVYFDPRFRGERG